MAPTATTSHAATHHCHLRRCHRCCAHVPCSRASAQSIHHSAVVQIRVPGVTSSQGPALPMLRLRGLPRWRPHQALPRHLFWLNATASKRGHRSIHIDERRSRTAILDQHLRPVQSTRARASDRDPPCCTPARGCSFPPWPGPTLTLRNLPCRADTLSSARSSCLRLASLT
jgi:hypothetical protein